MSSIESEAARTKSSRRSADERTGAPPTRVNWVVIVLGFLAVLIDGFDTATLAATVPSLAEEWGIAAGEFTIPLVLTNIGVVVGYMSAGYLGTRINQSRLLTISVASTALFTLLSAACLPIESITILAAVRLFTGIAIGIVLPVAISITTIHNPGHIRQRISVGVTLGLATGTTVGGVFGRYLIDTFGSAGMFLAGGILSIPLSIALAWKMRTPLKQDTTSEMNSEAKVSRLFERDVRTTTILLWCFSFLIFVAAYTLMTWVPTLLREYGFDASETPIGLAFVSFGGIIGGLILLPLTARIGIERALIVLPIVGVLAMVAIGATEPSGRSVLFLLLGAGAGVTAGQIGQLTMAVAAYPEGARTTGVGWAAAAGRMGSIVGPGIAGILISLSVSASSILLLATIPVLLAVVCSAVLARREKTRSSAKS